MKSIYLIIASMLLMATPVVADAADDVLPPPQGNVSNTSQLPMTQETEETTNLQEELTPKATQSGNIEINTYIRKSDQAKVTEYAINGRVYKMKIEPANGFAPYYLYDEKGNGQFTKRLAGGYKHLNPPEWIIHQF